MRITCIIALVLVVPSFGLCATIHIPADYPTIQEGINGAVHGDTVLVAPGTYIENLDFLGRAITVKSESGPHATVIDAYRRGSVVLFANSEGPDSIMEGFTLTNGTGTIDSPAHVTLGGGIFCDFTSPTLMGNHIVSNAASNGGGIHCALTSRPLILDNLIENNSAWDGAGIFSASSAKPRIEGNVIRGNYTSAGNGFGGGIYCENASGLNIMQNVITDNEAYSGGGIYCGHYGCPYIYRNIISGNRALSGSGGGLLCKQYADPVIQGNIISGNSAAKEGGGIWCWLHASPTMINNFFLMNSAQGEGGAIYCSNQCLIHLIHCTLVGNSSNTGGGAIYTVSSYPVIVNSILWNNAAPTGPEIWVGSSAYPSTLTIRYCDVKGGTASAQVDSGCTLDWGAGMINADPLFVDPLGDDHHLTYPSPCRNAGSNGASGIPGEDFEGDPRMAEGKVDMGADEFSPHLYYTGNATPGGNMELKFVGLPGAVINGLILGVDIFDPPLPCDYGLWYMKNPMQILFGFGTIPVTGVRIFPGTIPALPPVPYTLYLQAAIDSWLTNLCELNVE